jgi:hypothetical protein
MRRLLFISGLVSVMVPFLLNGATAAGGPQLPKFLKPISGTVSVDALPTSQAGAGAQPQASVAVALAPTTTSGGCADHSATNYRANQECTNQSAPGFLGRASSQNETAVAVNPMNANNVIISQNDYRNGDGACGVDFSFDGGTHWGSGLVPMNFGRGFMGAARHYWTSGGDTSVAFDSTGEAYLMCQVFVRPFPTNDEGDSVPVAGSSAFEIFRSSDGGASWSFPGNYVVKTAGAANGGLGLLDKEYMTIDAGAGSPYKDRIYVAWANYPADFSEAPIYFAYSSDHGVTWHQTGEISGFSATLCPISFAGRPAGTCNNSQFADPFVAPNGDVFVAFVNGDNCAGAFAGCPGSSGDNHSQILIVKSTDGGNTFGNPVKVGDYNELPDCLTYTGQDAFRSCVPTAPLSTKSIFRAANYPSGVAVTNQTIVVDYASYINAHSNPSNPTGGGKCRPNGFSSTTALPLYTGVGVVNGCNNDIVISTSSDGGASFSGTTTDVASLPTRNNEGSQLADQWFQWSAKTPSGDVVASYYDRQYGNDMSTGNMDFTLATPSSFVRVTDSSMPPANDFPASASVTYSTFMGDYTGLAVGSDGKAHPAWEDTRNPISTFNESADARTLTVFGFGGDIYTRSLSA